MPDLTALILAGGLGTRLRPVLDKAPKVLAPVLGRPFITYLLDQLGSLGLEEVVLCTGYLSSQIESTLGNCYKKIRIHYSVEKEPMGTGGALRQACSIIKTGTLLLMNGDSYLQADLNAFRQWHFDRKLSASLLTVHVEEAGRYGRVVSGEDGRIVRFVEKGPDRGPGWISAGIYLLERFLVETTIPPAKPFSLEKELWPILIESGFYAFPSGGDFLDIGTPADYARSEGFFQRVLQMDRSSLGLSE